MNGKAKIMLSRGVLLLSLLTTLLCASLFLGGCAQSTQGDSCTLLMYLCGSNLETRHGVAGKNIDELLEASIPPNTKIVIETGGSNTWHSHDIPSDKLCRYEVRDRQLVKVEELENASMGDPATLSDFLRWSEERYPSDRTMLVLWDHGGESASGICYDENYDMDCIDRDELTLAFRNANLSKKFNLVALDACFMASLENAALLDDYANYLIASQEIVPSNGLDYKAIASEFSANDDLQFGKLVCDSFMSKCEAAGKRDRAEIALLDLSKASDMLKEFDKFCNYLDELLNERTGIMMMSNASRGSAMYGAKTICNLVDLLSLAEGVGYQTSAGFGTMMDTHQEFVAHEVLGRNREGFGVSVYYPLEYKKKQFETYLESCPSELYGRLLSKVYSDEPSVTVAFKDPGSKNKSGDFAVVVTEGSEHYIRSITNTLWKEDEHTPGSYVKLGEDYDIDQDWNSLTFTSRFKGLWPALEKHRLYTEVSLTSSSSATFFMPVQVNDEKTSLATYYLFGDNDTYAAGFFASPYLWGGINENGIPERDFKDLQPGDKVRVYAAADEEGLDLRPQDEFAFAGAAGEDESSITYEPLPDGRYRYQMTVTDLFGHQFVSNYAHYTIHGGIVTLDS